MITHFSTTAPKSGKIVGAHQTVSQKASCGQKASMTRTVFVTNDMAQVDCKKCQAKHA